MKSHTAPIHACRMAFKTLFPNKIFPSSPPWLARSTGSLLVLRTSLLFISLICLRIGQPVSCACDPCWSHCCETFQLKLATCCIPAPASRRGLAAPTPGPAPSQRAWYRTTRISLWGRSAWRRGWEQGREQALLGICFLPDKCLADGCTTLLALLPDCALSRLFREGRLFLCAPRLWVQPCVACAMLLEVTLHRLLPQRPPRLSLLSGLSSRAPPMDHLFPISLRTGAAGLLLEHIILPRLSLQEPRLGNSCTAPDSQVLAGMVILSGRDVP